MGGPPNLRLRMLFGRHLSERKLVDFVMRKRARSRQTLQGAVCTSTRSTLGSATAEMSQVDHRIGQCFEGIVDIGDELEASQHNVSDKEAARKELWRHGRLAILRSVSGTTQDTGALVPGRDAAGLEDGTQQPNALARAQGNGDAREGWTDEGVRCKRLGALLGSAHVVARTAAALSPDLCESLAPARVGTLAAQVACRVSARGAKGDLKALASLAPGLPTIAPRCGEAYARACAAIFEARLSDSPAEGCRALAKDTSVAAIEAWACGVEARADSSR